MVKRLLGQTIALMSIFYLSGCGQEEVDPIQQLNQYRLFINHPEMAPKKINIKEQVITQETPYGLTKTTVKNNKHGQIISYTLEYASDNTLRASDRDEILIDYDNQLWTTKSGENQVNCQFDLNKQHQVTRADCELTGETSGHYILDYDYQSGKLINIKEQGDQGEANAYLTWNQNEINNIESEYTSININQNFYYDSTGLLSLHKFNFHQFKDNLRFEYSVIFDRHNQNGDWTEAIYRMGDNKYKITREITYW